jgi:hypothetical protein
MIRSWLLLPMAVAIAACSPGQTWMAHSPGRQGTTSTPLRNHSPVPGDMGSTASGGKSRPAALPHVTYPSFGINVSARPPATPGAPAADAVSPAAVLTAFKVQGDASLVGPAQGTERPVILLRTITELHPTAPGVRPHVPYTGWVVIYHHVMLVSYGLRPFPAHPRGTFVAILDAATGQWTNFFSF